MSQKNRQKIINKYLSNTQSKNIHSSKYSNQQFLIKDNDDLINSNSSNNDNQSNQSSSKQKTQHKRKRVYSQDQQLQKQSSNKKKIHKSQQQQRDHRINKKLKKAFGIKSHYNNNQQDQQQEQFINQVKIQGIDQKQLKQYLKNNKKAQINFQFQGKKQKKNKKQKKKKRKRHDSSDQINQQQNQLNQNQRIKKELFGKQQSSDLQIPQQARVVYRNKDGTIRNQSQQQQKQRHKQMVMERLAQWQKGMKKQGVKGQGSSQQQQDYDIQLAKKQVFDDPMRRWEMQSKQINPLKCKFEGYGNRFDIKPGFRWDGVIRGNGFQNKLLQDKNIRKMKQQKQGRQYLKNL